MSRDYTAHSEVVVAVVVGFAEDRMLVYDITQFMGVCAPSKCVAYRENSGLRSKLKVLQYAAMPTLKTGTCIVAQDRAAWNAAMLITLQC